MFACRADGWRKRASPAVRGSSSPAEEGKLVITLAPPAPVEQPAKVERNRLSLNVHAATLGRDAGFVTFLLNTARDSAFAAKQLIVEIVEYAPVWNEPVLSSVAELRDAVVRIAVDDIGLGHSNLRMILDVEPELFKIDRYFVDGCHADPRRVAVIASVCQLARSFGAATIAEGIEEACDVAPLVDCGVSLFQGYFFGKPVIVTN